jgi:hypothetical protein
VINVTTEMLVAMVGTYRMSKQALQLGPHSLRIAPRHTQMLKDVLQTGQSAAICAEDPLNNRHSGLNNRRSTQIP